jgi:hypothetical protein
MKLKIRKSPHSLGPAFQPEAWHCWPGLVAESSAGTACFRWCGGAADDLGVARPVGTPWGSDGSCVGHGGRRGSHQRRPAAVVWRKWPDATVFQGSDGAPVAGEDIDESCSWRRGRER